jgi:four helix bundle protein
MDAFERLEVWKRSSRLCVNLYKALSQCKDRGFKSQITRSALSVPSNIAEGYERDSRNEYIRFFENSQGIMRRITHPIIYRERNRSN